MSRWVEGKVLAQKRWTDTLYSLYVEAPIEPFTAGQFAQIGLMMGGKIVFRPYSFVNEPNDPQLEFYYTHLSNGQLTEQLVQLKPNDMIYVSRRASGRFTLERVPDASTLWLIATGTGLGVFLSLLRTPILWERFKKVILVHSVRHHDELSHQDVISALIGNRFQFIPIVTREKVANTLHHRIPRLIEDGQLELASDSQVMLCGNPSMVKEVTHVLTSKGLLGQITVESYWKE